jgi:hypothetical protein
MQIQGRLPALRSRLLAPQSGLIPKATRRKTGKSLRKQLTSGCGGGTAEFGQKHTLGECK